MHTKSCLILPSLLLALTVTAHSDHSHTTTTSTDESGHNEGHPHTHSFAIKAHGTLLTLAFTFLYPAGVILIRSSLAKSFLYHWTVQAVATASAIVGMLIMIVRSWNYLLSGNASPHHILGSTLFLTLILQLLLGYYHHILFLKFRRRTYISYAHIVLGWLVMCGGWINTVLGFQIGGISTALTTIWLIWLVLASMLMIKAPALAGFIRGRREKARYDAIGQEEGKERKDSSDTLRDDSFMIGE